MPAAETSSTAASVAMLRAFEAETKLWYSSTEKTTISATRIRPIEVVDPVTKRCQPASSRRSAALVGLGLVGSVRWSSRRSCRLLVTQRAGHRADDVLHRHLAALEARDPLAEAQDLDAVGDLEDLGHVVADQHDRRGRGRARGG